MEPCVDTDDCTGHYTCVDNQKECLDGYDGDDCNSKIIEKNQVDSDCRLGETAFAECSNLGYCFNSSCCCETEGLQNENRCLDIDECESDPCMNGATCRNNRDSFFCVCPDGMLI